MECRTSWADRPLWVRVGLFGIPSRKAAILWMKGSLGAVIVALGTLIVAPVFAGQAMSGLGMSVVLAALLAPVMLIAPFWYWLAIRWADEHEGWALHTWKS